MVTVIVVLALAVVGTGAAFAYRTYMGAPRSGEPPIIRADAGPTKIVPAPADASRQGARSHGERRWHREDRSARGSPGRRQCEIGSARGISAAEPEWQSAVRGERGSRRRRRRPTPAMARCPTMSRARSGPCPCRATSPTPAATPVAAAPPAVKPAANAARRADADPVSGQCECQCATVAGVARAAGGAQPAEPPTRVATTNPAQIVPSGCQRRRIPRTGLLAAE